MKLDRLFRTPVAVVAATVILSGSVFAFAARNTVDQSSAGAGSEAISGYTTTDVTYKFDETNPDHISYVQFSLVPTIAGSKNAATHVVAKLQPTDTYASATAVGTPAGTGETDHYTTTWKLTSTLPMTDVTQLSIVAASGPIPQP